jgi:selenocysteine lyase/cysteine desulfurase
MASFTNNFRLTFPIENDEQIVKAYADAITPRTKIIHVTHIINWVGQIMPVKKIAQMAHAKGIEVVCDGAHTFGLLDYKIPDLECDYFGTSLHKFLSAPVGSGMMWIKKDKIEKIWPLLCNSEPKSGNIRKFETLGTRSFPIEQAIGEAINFQEGIGSKRKQDRIHYLKKYWAEKAAQIPGCENPYLPETGILLRDRRCKHRRNETRGARRQTDEGLSDTYRGNQLGEYSLRARHAACVHENE